MQGTPGLVRYNYNPVTKSAVTDAVLLGSEDRPTHAPGWDSEQVTGPMRVIAFSLRPVRVVFEDEHPVVLSPSVVALPAASTPYRRTPSCASGQRTVFVGVHSDAFTKLVGAVEPALLDRLDEQPRHFAPSDLRACALACRLERIVFKSDTVQIPVDPLLIDETVTEIIVRTISDSTAPKPTTRTDRRAPSPQTQRRWRAAANEAMIALTRNPESPPTLDGLADSLKLSPAYLGRVFRHQFGQTMHHCYSAARLIRTLEHLPDAKGRLTQLALSSGFASHAHMTGVFRSTLGVSPSELCSDSAAALRADLAARQRS